MCCRRRDGARFLTRSIASVPIAALSYSWGKSDCRAIVPIFQQLIGFRLTKRERAIGNRQRLFHHRRLEPRTLARVRRCRRMRLDRHRSSRPARPAGTARRRARRAATDRDGRPLRRADSSGAKPVICLIKPACASTRRISSAFCSPVEASAAGMFLPACATTRSDKCGPSSVRPAAASRARLSFRSAR